MAFFLAFLDLGLGDLAGVDQGLDALLGELLAVLAHAQRQQLASEPVLSAVVAIVISTIFTLLLGDGPAKAAVENTATAAAIIRADLVMGSLMGFDGQALN